MGASPDPLTRGTAFDAFGWQGVRAFVLVTLGLVKTVVLYLVLYLVWPQLQSIHR